MARYSRGVSPNGILRGILNTWRAYFAKTSSFWMHGSDILPRRRVFTVRGSFGNASGRYFARNEAHRLLGVRFEGASFKGHPSAVRERASKMLRPGFFGCAGEQRIVIAVSLPCQSATSVPWALGDAVPRSFRRRMSPLMRMATERVEHERVQMRAWRRCCSGALALQDFDGRCCHGALALRGLVGHCCPGAPALRALAAAMLIAGKRNRSPRNVVGRGNRSSQCSLLW